MKVNVVVCKSKTVTLNIVLWVSAKITAFSKVHMYIYCHCTVCNSAWFVHMWCLTVRHRETFYNDLEILKNVCLDIRLSCFVFQWIFLTKGGVFVFFKKNAFLQIFLYKVTSSSERNTWMRWCALGITKAVWSDEYNNRNRQLIYR